MAEKQEKSEKQEKKQEKVVEKKVDKKLQEKAEFYENLIRIKGFDIPSNKKVFPGLTKIKGISWTISNAICLNTGIPKDKKISDLSKEELKKIEEQIENLNVPDFFKNRRFDFETGKTTHLYGTDLDMKKSFDIKRLRKIKSYRGLRHATGQPTRGQRTRSHFRTRGKAVGVQRKKEAKK